MNRQILRWVKKATLSIAGFSMIFAMSCGRLVPSATQSEPDATPAVINYLEFRSSSYQVSRGELLNLVTQITPNVTAADVIWIVQNPDVAVVDASGTVEGLTAGQTLVQAVLLSNQSVSTSVLIVVSATVNQHLTQSDLTLYKSETYTLSLQGESGLTLRWRSSSPNVASIDLDTGMVTARDLGESMVTAYDALSGDPVGTCRIKVESKVRGIVVQPKQMTCAVGAQFTVDSTVQTVDPSGDTSVSWLSSNPNVVDLMLDQNDGHFVGFKAKSVGTATLTARATAATEKSATVAVTVVAAEATGINLFPLQTTVVKDKTVTLFATVDSDQAVSWRSMDTSIATVSSNGVVTGKQAGVVSIVASAGAATATATVTVSDPSLSEVIVTPRSGEINISGVQTLTAAVFPSDVGQGVTWTVSDSTILDLDIRLTPIKVTGRKAGRAQVRATSTVNPAYFGVADIVVKSPAVGTVNISPTSLSIFQGQTATLTATIQPAGADQTVTWRSLDVVKAEVSGGLVTGRAAGTTQIEARSAFDTTKSKLVTVEVKPMSITSVTVAPNREDLVVGDALTLTATVVPNTVSAVRWRSADDMKIRVSQSGRILAVAPTVEGVDIRAYSKADDTKIGVCLVGVLPPIGSVDFSLVDRGYWGPDFSNGDVAQRVAFLTNPEIDKIKNQSSGGSTEWISSLDLTNNYYLAVYVEETATNLYAFVKSLVFSGGRLTVNVSMPADPQFSTSDVVLPNHAYVRIIVKIPKATAPLQLSTSSSLSLVVN